MSYNGIVFNKLGINALYTLHCRGSIRGKTAKQNQMTSKSIVPANGLLNMGDNATCWWGDDGAGGGGQWGNGAGHTVKKHSPQ